MEKETKQKVIGLVGVGLAFTAGIGGGFLADNPDTIVETVVEEKLVEVIKEVPVIETVIVEKNVTVEVEVPVEKIIEVADEEFITLLCDRDSYDDIKECEEEVKAEDAALKLAIAEIEKEFADELEDAGIVEAEDDVEIVRIYDDYEDLISIDSDFDDEEYRFEIKVKIDDDEADEKKYVVFDVEVEDDETKIRNVTEI